MSDSTVTILIADDDEIDREAVKRAFRQQRIANPIIEAENGLEVLEILRGTHHTKKIDKPFLVLLDLKMPKKDGMECLKEIRNDKNLQKSIVFMMTTSKLEEEKSLAFELNVNGYLQKANAGPGFIKLVEMIDGYWKVVEFP